MLGNKGQKRLLLGGALAALTSAVAITLRGDQNVNDKETHSIQSSAEGNVSNDRVDHLLEDAIAKSRIWMARVKETTGVPGLVVAVSVDGKQMWEEGIGHSDVENKVPCSPETVMRIASISKSITMLLVARYWEKGLLDMDKAVHEYVPGFPQKTHEGRKVTVTSRHLASHQSGIRHYKIKATATKDNRDEQRLEERDYDTTEILSMQKYESVTEALKLFKDDPLAFKPGTNYLYTTHGFTLLSAVVEEVSKTPFAVLATTLFRELGMNNTYLDYNGPIIYNRSKYYVRNKHGRIENAPYVDNSYKWAGGGFVSTVGDLVRFGNVMLYASQHGSSSSSTRSAALQNGCSACSPGFLKRDTVVSMWTPSKMEKTDKKESSYGLGWCVNPGKPQYGMCKDQRRFIFHAGGAMGASSTLVIMLPKDKEQGLRDQCFPKGVVVAAITNLSRVELTKMAFDIAKEFDRLSN